MARDQFTGWPDRPDPADPTPLAGFFGPLYWPEQDRYLNRVPFGELVVRVIVLCKRHGQLIADVTDAMSDDLADVRFGGVFAGMRFQIPDEAADEVKRYDYRRITEDDEVFNPLTRNLRLSTPWFAAIDDRFAPQFGSTLELRCRSCSGGRRHFASVRRLRAELSEARRTGELRRLRLTADSQPDIVG